MPAKHMTAKRHSRIILIAFSIVSAAVVCCSVYLDITPPGGVPAFVFLFLFAASVLGVFAMVSALWKLLDMPRNPPRAVSCSNKALFGISFLVICACWAAVMLAGFPGFFNYDGIEQWQQFQSGTLTSHHPVLHTLYLGATISLGLQLTGSINAGIFLAVTTQAVMISLILSATIICLRECRIGLTGIALAIAYYSLNPIIGMLALSTTKDSFFSALVVAYCWITFFWFADSREKASASNHFKFGTKRLHIGLFAALTALTMVLRVNAVPAIILSVTATALVLRKKPQTKLYIQSSVIGIAVALLILGPVSSLAGIEPSKAQQWNAAAVPIQQIARCTVDESVSAEDKREIEELLGVLDYRSNNSDNAREKVHPLEITFGDILPLYLKLGTTYPKTYFEALLFQTEDAWSPLSTIDAYEHPVTNTYEGLVSKTSVFEFTAKRESATKAGALYSKLPQLADALMFLSTAEDAAKIPFLNLIISIWPFLLILVICTIRCLSCRRFDLLMPAIPLILLSFSNLVGPCMLLRYFYYLILGLPLMIAFIYLTKPQSSISN